MDYVFQMKNVSKTFGEVQAVHNINFEVGTNEIVGLLGDNGAGKSSLLRVLNLLEMPRSGTLAIAGNHFDFAKTPSDKAK